jgi:hypothetical protein
MVRNLRNSDLTHITKECVGKLQGIVDVMDLKNNRPTELSLAKNPWVHIDKSIAELKLDKLDLSYSVRTLNNSSKEDDKQNQQDSKNALDFLFESINPMKHLKILNLNNNDLNPDFFNKAEIMPSVTSLYFENNQVTEKTLADIVRVFPKMTTLNLDISECTDFYKTAYNKLNDIGVLKTAANLTTLNLSGRSNLFTDEHAKNNCVILNNLTQLESLALQKAGINDENLELFVNNLVQLHRLKSLSLWGNSIKDIKNIVLFGQILNVAKQRITIDSSADWQAILNIFTKECGLGDCELNYILFQCPSFIQFFSAENLNNIQEMATAAAEVAKVTKMEYKAIACCQHKNYSFKQLCAMLDEKKKLLGNQVQTMWHTGLRRTLLLDFLILEDDIENILYARENNLCNKIFAKNTKLPDNK